MRPRHTFFVNIVAIAISVCIVAPLLAVPLTARAYSSVQETGPSLIVQIFNSIKNALSSAANYLNSTNINSLVLKEYVLDPLANFAAQAIIRAMTNQIIGWIQGRNSGFIENINEELLFQVDQAGGEFLNQLTGINLCGNISAFLNITLRLPGLRQRLQCSVTDIVRNVQNFYNNFSQGGWPAFIRISLEPQNNPYGAYFIALDAKIAYENRAKQRVEKGFAIGKGFLGFETRNQVCENVAPEATADILAGSAELGAVGVEIQSSPNLRSSSEQVRNSSAGRIQTCRTVTKTRTPGEVFAEGLKNSVYAGLDSAKLADEINEAIASILTAFLTQVISKSSGGGGGVFDRDLTTTLPPVQLSENPSIAFFTSAIDRPLLQLQQLQVDKGREIANLDFRIFRLSIDIALIRKSCEEPGTLPNIPCDQARIATLESEKTALETEKAGLATKMRGLDTMVSRLVNFRNRGFNETDPGRLQSINSELNGILLEATRAIQDAAEGSGPTVRASDNGVDNLIESTTLASTHAGTGIQLYERKISLIAASTSATSTNITLITASTSIPASLQSLRNVFQIRRTELAGLLDNLTASRLDLLSARDAGRPLTEIISRTLQHIVDINRKVAEALGI